MPTSYVAESGRRARPGSFFSSTQAPIRRRSGGASPPTSTTSSDPHSPDRGRRPRTPDRQSLGFSTNFSPTPFWSLSWSSQYNITDGKFESQVVRLERELHEWRAAFNFVRNPNGNFAFYFSIYLTDLPELKFDYDQTTIEQLSCHSRVGTACLDAGSATVLCRIRANYLRLAPLARDLHLAEPPSSEKSYAWLVDPGACSWRRPAPPTTAPGPACRPTSPATLSSTTLDGAIALTWTDNAYTSDPGNFQNYRVYSTTLQHRHQSDDVRQLLQLEGTTVAPEFVVGALDQRRAALLLRSPRSAWTGSRATALRCAATPRGPTPATSWFLRRQFQNAQERVPVLGRSQR